MVQQGRPGPWQPDDNQGFPYWGLRDVGKALQIVLDTQLVAEQSEALVAEGQAAEQVQLRRALIGRQQALEGLPKSLVTPLRQARASLGSRHERGG
jgi:hypothetical protein